MELPQDVFMLFSMINMKLRDGDFESLSDLCDSLEINEQEIIEKLRKAGFEYHPDLRQFR